jgi:hypothetical protein
VHWILAYLQPRDGSETAPTTPAAQLSLFGNPIEIIQDDAQYWLLSISVVIGL